VHPEAYSVVRRMQAAVGGESVVGNVALLKSLRAEKFVDETFGLPTVTDILRELEKPGRDPRPEFKTATFADGVEKLGDLKPGMVLEGVVTNVAAFGAFVDIGVHQDGLVHISALSSDYVKDPRDVVKSGDVVKVKVMEVDIPRKRIGLTMRLQDEPGKPKEPQQRGGGGGQQRGGGGQRGGGQPKPRQDRAPAGGAMAEALRRAGLGGS
jgi:uncharacterized protein